MGNTPPPFTAHYGGEDEENATEGDGTTTTKFGIGISYGGICAVID